MSSLIDLSKELLKAVRDNADADEIALSLASLEFNELQSQLSDDQQRLVFWINIYNAYYQILRTKMGLERPQVFTKRVIKLGGKMLSLDDIEHGILRKYRYKYSLGYFVNVFAPAKVKQLAVSKIDFRIHFALNCGAVSCPPIAFYSLENLEEQLTKATFSFIQTETDILVENKQVFVSRILFWFMGDFGGLMGIRQLLESTFGRSLKGYKISFKTYSWEDKLANFVTE